MRRANPDTLKAIVAHYRHSAARREREAEWWKAKGLSFAEARDRIARAETERGRHPHQSSLSKETINGCVSALKQISEQLEAASSFHEIFDLVEKAFKPVYGAGELAVYDAADRLAHRRGFTPTLIYLHAGTAEGARMLTGKRPRNEAWSMTLRELPKEFQVLSEREAEDVLCHYRKYFFEEPEAIDRLNEPNC